MSITQGTVALSEPWASWEPCIILLCSEFVIILRGLLAFLVSCVRANLGQLAKGSRELMLKSGGAILEVDSF